MAKVLIFVFQCFAIFCLTLGSPSARGLKEDADQAFQAFLDLSKSAMRNVMTNINMKIAQVNRDLELKELETVSAIDGKMSEVRLKMAETQALFKSWNITRCQSYSIDKYQATLKARAQKCTKLTAGVLNQLIETTTADVQAQQNNFMGCYSRSLAFCGSFGTDDSCFEFLISSIDEAKGNMVKNFQLIETNTLSKIVTLKLPCQDLIEFELSVYPDYTVHYLSQCGETETRNARAKTCSF